jgi:predicted AAA+ superfamily ATPase
MPFLRRRGAARRRWFEQYRAAYVERDVPPLVQVEEIAALVRFLTLVASRTAQTTNYAALAHESGISADTGLRWFGALEATFLADLVPPYWRNIGKRLVKSPKIHFGDAGLGAHLAGVRNWADALRQNMAGALLETLVAQHLLAFCDTSRRATSLFHYRTHAGAEVDLVLSRGRRLLPLEVKLSSTVRPPEARGMQSFLQDFRGSAPFGVVLYAGLEAVPVARGIVAVPVTALLDASPGQ